MPAVVVVWVLVVVVTPAGPVANADPNSGPVLLPVPTRSRIRAILWMQNLVPLF